MKKLKNSILLQLMFICINWGFSQETKIFSFLPSHAIENPTKWIYRKLIYTSDSTFIDSAFFHGRHFKISNNKWFVENNKTWITFFDNGLTTYFSLHSSSESITCRIEWTEIDCCNEEMVFLLRFKPIDENQFLIDYPDYYFTSKDGIIIIETDFFYIREDKLDIGREILRNRWK